MRLNELQIEAIKEAFDIYLPGAEVFLYGSRIDDAKRGGDIDLLIEADHKPTIKSRSQIKSFIWNKIGEQKIDMVFNYPGNQSSFIELIRLESIKLYP